MRTHACEPARHHLPALRGAGDERAQHERTGLQATFGPGRRGRQGHCLLRHPVPAFSAQAAQQVRALVRIQLRGQHGGLPVLVGEPGRERRAEHQSVEPIDDVVAHRRRAAPCRVRGDRRACARADRPVAFAEAGRRAGRRCEEGARRAAARSQRAAPGRRDRRRPTCRRCRPPPGWRDLAVARRHGHVEQAAALRRSRG